MREPGLLGIGLSDDSLTCEIIADSCHTPSELVKIVWRCNGERMAIVSDCLRAGGMPRDGRFWTLGAEPGCTAVTRPNRLAFSSPTALRDSPTEQDSPGASNRSAK